MHDPVGKPGHVRSLGQHDRHLDLPDVLAALVEFQLTKIAKRPRPDEPDDRLAE